MKTIDPTTGILETIEVPTFELDEVTGGNDEYIYKSSIRVTQLFNKTWLSRYMRP